MDLIINDATEETFNFSPPVDPTIIFGPQRDSLYIVIPITIIYVLIFITGLVGNIFTCIVIIRNKSMHTATNYYLFSLAISDLLLLVSGMPQEMYSIWSKWPYVFGHSFCLIRGLAAETSTNASVLTITLFTIERYLAICHPFLSHKMSKLSRASKHVLLLWVAALALALPQALQFSVAEARGVTMCLQTRVIIKHSFEMSTFFFFFAPMVLITVLYALIGLRLRKTNLCKNNKGKEELDQNMRFTHPIRRKPSQSTKRVVKMLVAVVVAFFVCWAPFHAQRLVAIYGTGEQHQAISSVLLFVYSVLTYTSGVFYYMSTCINPIFYHIMSNKFREAFKNTMKQCCCRGRASSGLTQRCSYSAVARNPNSSGTNHSGNSVRMDTPPQRSTRPDNCQDNIRNNVNGNKRNLYSESQPTVDGDRRKFQSSRLYSAQSRLATSCASRDTQTTHVETSNSVRMDTPPQWSTRPDNCQDNIRNNVNGNKRNLYSESQPTVDGDRRKFQSSRLYSAQSRLATSCASRDTQTTHVETSIVNERNKFCAPTCCSYQESPSEAVPTLAAKRNAGSEDNETEFYQDELRFVKGSSNEKDC